jgi:hypothetical protein
MDDKKITRVLGFATAGLFVAGFLLNALAF